MKSRRLANRVLVGVVLMCLIVVAAGEFYDHSRVDAILQGRINLAEAEINANGVTIAQAERALNAALQRDSSAIAALKAEVGALEARDAELDAELQALQAQLQGGGTPSSPTGSPTPTPPHGGAPSPTPLHNNAQRGAPHFKGPHR